MGTHYIGSLKLKINTVGFFLNLRIVLYKLCLISGAWPSGKAAGFDPVYRRFESYRPSQIVKLYNNRTFHI